MTCTGWKPLSFLRTPGTAVAEGLRKAYVSFVNYELLCLLWKYMEILFILVQSFSEALRNGMT